MLLKYGLCGGASPNTVSKKSLPHPLHSRRGGFETRPYDWPIDDTIWRLPVAYHVSPRHGWKNCKQSVKPAQRAMRRKPGIDHE